MYFSLLIDNLKMYYILDSGTREFRAFFIFLNLSPPPPSPQLWADTWRASLACNVSMFNHSSWDTLSPRSTPGREPEQIHVPTLPRSFQYSRLPAATIHFRVTSSCRGHPSRRNVHAIDVSWFRCGNGSLLSARYKCQMSRSLCGLDRQKIRSPAWACGWESWEVCHLHLRSD